MKLTGITNTIGTIESVAAIRVARDRTRVFGLLRAARPAVMAAVFPPSDPGIVVTAHPQAAREMAEELSLWTEQEVELFPAVESLPYERVRVDRATLAQRERVVRRLSARDAIIVVAPVRALLQPVQAVSRLSAPLCVSRGQVISVPKLIAYWVEGGYAETTLVEEQGTFARRGGVLDVFPVGASAPVRIELFGNEVESIRTFDAATQRSSASAEAVTIEPIAALDERARLEALDALMQVDTGGMNAEAQTHWLDDLARLESGAPLDELAVFSPYLVPPSSLFDHLGRPALIMLDESHDVQTVMDELWDQSHEVQRDLEESGNLPAGLRPALLEPSRLRERLSIVRVVEWISGSMDTDGIDLSGLFVPAAVFGGRLRAFTRALASHSSRRTVIVSQQAARIEELLAEDGLSGRLHSELPDIPADGVSILHGMLPEGWWLPDIGLVLFTDHEVFGKARSRPVPRRRAVRSAFFAEFSPGDYVVHTQHGIGRFDSITRVSVEGTEREYALIQYAGSDRVYVPTDQLERLTRYIGTGDAPPRLSKLGGAEWQRARQRARKTAEDIARQLIDLYAKRAARPGHAFPPDTPWEGELESSFAYPETVDQAQAIEAVKVDMEEPRPMDRLVCADVGYGKTEVAVRAAFKAVMDGHQVAVLVPTTILAQQHFETFAERLAPFPVTIEVLSRFRSPARQRAILQRVTSGEVDILIGTHRILQKDVHFKQLGLLVIDEEQRFGVRHKERLKQLRETVDVLTLTATPIPRTLHMTLVGIREVSVIDTAPEGRLPIKTFLQPFDERLHREAIIRELDRDGQVYVVHNKVASIEAMAERIRRLVPEARVVVGHGQMDESHLEKVMLEFAHHERDVLVCSTIIENGLDIPNVNTIIVNNAHTLGLTQLYQLRGRVGRSANQAYAYLLYPRDAPLSHDAARRLEAIFEAQELGAGFNIAMKDLEIRGAGNLLGAEQSGSAAAIGFDLYTRMVSDAVERLRGVPVEEPPSITLDLPLSMFLPAEYVGSESERLTLYRRLAGVTSTDDLNALVEEIRDRFGALPVEVQNLVTSVEIKLAAVAARVSTIRLDGYVLVMKTERSGIYDRVSLYRAYGSEARITNNMLRVPRYRLEDDWLGAIRTILQDMRALRESLADRAEPQAESAGVTA